MSDELKVTLDGREVGLTCSLRAAKKLSEKYGGLLPIMDVLNFGSLQAATDVMFYALDKKDADRETLETHVYDAGLKYLAPHLVRYLIALMNGGKVPPPAAPVAADA